MHIREVQLASSRVETWSNGCEKNAVHLTYDAKEFFEIWPDASVTVAFERADGKQYLHMHEMDGSVVHVSLQPEDTEKAGVCKVQITVDSGKGIANTKVFHGRVTMGLNNPGEKPSFVQQGVIDQTKAIMADAIKTAEESAATAKEIADELVYVGSETPPDKAVLWINPNGQTSSGGVVLDVTLTQQGMAADAAAVGERLQKHTDYMVSLFEQLKQLILAGDNAGAIAVLDQAILDNAILA